MNEVMKKNKFFIRILSICLLLCFSCNTVSYALNDAIDESVVQNIVGDEVYSSERFSLIVDEENATFSVFDNLNNKIYSATPSDASEDEIAVGRFSTELSSVLLISYCNDDAEAEMTANSYTNSLLEGGFSVHKIEDGVILLFDFPGEGITVPMYIRIKDEALSISIPIKKIKEYKENKVTSITVLPFFGAGGVFDEGYLFVPVGSGGLIDFNNQKSKAGQFTGYVYGSNKNEVAIQKRLNIENIHLAAFGIKCNDDAFIASIDSGAAQSMLTAYSSGIKNSYNTVYSTFEIRESTIYTIDNGWQGTKSFMYYQDSQPALNEIRVSYHFLDNGAGYTDMALKLREIYLKNGTLKERKPEVSPLISVMGALHTKESFIGIPYTKKTTITSVSELLRISEELFDNCNSALSYRYFNWSSSAASGKLQNKLSLDSSLGDKKELISAIKKIKSNSQDIYLDVSPWTYQKQNNPFQNLFNATKNLIGVKVQLPYYTLSTGVVDEKLPKSMLVKPSKLIKYSRQLSESVKKIPATGFSVSGLDGLNYSDFSNEVYERNDTQNRISAAVEKLNGYTGNTMLETPSQSVLSSASYIYDMPSNCGGMLAFDRSIPFYQLVVSGLISYAGEAINLTADPSLGLLNCLRNGSAPHYVIGMNMSDDPLYGTEYETIVSADYGALKDGIVEVITKYNSVMKTLGSNRICDFIYLDEEVTKTIYDSGLSVIVNTGEKAYRIGETVVEPCEYKILEG